MNYQTFGVTVTTTVFGGLFIAAYLIIGSMG